VVGSPSGIPTGSAAVGVRGDSGPVVQLSMKQQRQREEALARQVQAPLAVHF
jgi:hypothetical protein